LPFWLAAAGVGTAWYFYMQRQDIPAMLMQRFRLIYTILINKYGFDTFNDWFFAGGIRRVGGLFWRFGDAGLIDGIMVNGSARLVAWGSRMFRVLQSGYIYHYAFAMLLGVFALVTFFIRAT
jgi:NADH-quinone oxidoreductase subunit L